MTFAPVAAPTAQDAAEALARLGPALLDSGAVDQRTLERARRVASETGGRLDRVTLRWVESPRTSIARGESPLSNFGFRFF